MQQRYLYVFIGIGIVLLGGVFWVWSKRTEQPPNKNTEAGENLVKKEFRTTALTGEGDHVLSRAKITGVTDKEGPHKQITVSNPKTIFLFEVPDTWLSETRNSGEVEMNEEELREFFATNYFGDLRDNPDGLLGNYWDVTWNMLKDISFDEMKAVFEKGKFPNASVGSGRYIGYYGPNQYQVDFYVLSVQDSKERFDYDTTQRNMTPISVGGLRAKKDVTPPDIYPAGDTWMFVPLPDTQSILVIHKQGYSDDFDTGFNHLLKSFRFRDS